MAQGNTVGVNRLAVLFAFQAHFLDPVLHSVSESCQKLEKNHANC